MHSEMYSSHILRDQGTYNTPQLLELSGIGSPEILNKVGIPVKVDLPQVGENLMVRIALCHELDLCSLQLRL
jgi:choline dehydrogenase-like flavoprotein